ncbi:MAG TPA: PAS domain-containing sensor histidine kinase [Ktedonobacteraceae bacterium]
MRKSRYAALPRNQRREGRSAKKPVSSSPKAESSERQSEHVLLRQLEEIFACLPDGLIACDRDGKILRLNGAALHLFEVPSEHQYQGKDCREFLAPYVHWNNQPYPVILTPYQSYPNTHEASLSHLSTQTSVLQTSSGRKVEVSLTRSPMHDAQQHIRGMVMVFHELTAGEQHALHFQRVAQAVLALNEAIAHLPERLLEESGVLTGPEWLLSPPVIFIAQQLVDVIHQVLRCDRVSLKALGEPAHYIHYVAGSGFSAEQEEPERTTSDLVTLSEVFDKELVARLLAKQEVVVCGSRLHIPPELGSFASDQLLIIPLFLQKHLTGMLCIIKTGLESVYTPEEIAAVKAVANQAVLLVECLHALSTHINAHMREQALQEVHRLSQDFLILASHELSTPLTGIVGNLQLAQRRLKTLQRRLVAQRGQVGGEHLLQAQQPLASASHSARLQQRMINDLIDDACLQANRLRLHLQQCDLLVLINALVTRYQQDRPDHQIVLEGCSGIQKIPVFVDAERISRVLTTYLANALASSPAASPVTVQVVTEEGSVRVMVQNEGPGIPSEEQQHLWERFYRAKWGTVQHELDLSLGLGFYLCRALIEHQRGTVGVQSAPGHGATFWFTLPLAL